MPLDAKLTQQQGFVQAGAITTLCSTVCGFATLSLMVTEAAVLTTKFKINPLSPAMADRFVAVGRVVRRGKN